MKWSVFLIDIVLMLGGAVLAAKAFGFDGYRGFLAGLALCCFRLSLPHWDLSRNL